MSADAFLLVTPDMTKAGVMVKYPVFDAEASPIVAKVEGIGFTG